MKLDALGWLSGVRRVPSPNRDARPPRSRIELLVIHGISLPPNEYGGREIEQFFTNTLDHDAHPYFGQLRNVKVSSHFLIRRDGGIVQFVPCGARAWHAGVSNWRGRERCNDFSIGIELEGSDHEPYTPCQYTALVRLSRLLMRRYPITGIARHSDIAPGRKTDPGPCFDRDGFMAHIRSTSPLQD